MWHFECCGGLEVTRTYPLRGIVPRRTAFDSNCAVAVVLAEVWQSIRSR
jgi:hypothetical protein